MKNYYEILGVDEHVDAKTLKKKFRELALKYHPDLNQDNQISTNKFKEINEAYNTLSDSHSRAKYDASINGQSEYNSGVSDFSDIFSSFFGYQSQQTKPQNESNTFNLKIKLEDIEKKELKKVLNIRQKVKCQNCSGKGGEIVKRCHTCNGLGKLSTTRQQGNMYIQNVSSCNTCAGRGKLISKMCMTCHGEGKITNNDVYDVNITFTKKDYAKR